ncbi:hypothetical protein DIE15_35570 [Burkholderia sp. Bp9031]|uniref:hypothetical protein n=1 Tax=unclassified Burkholderia TaxID=2613784 RepID=UPI000716413B|nr:MULTISPECIES: hypothetical protein [unclassified Burkholderia]RQZ05671.1 hypothetical protein DIE15_35570 [Burkholderia sp. Bp9031]
MSTPATFTFALQYGGNATFYARSGGYPAGAAVYLLAAHLSDALASLADRFYRANEAFELTTLDVHKDLSYGYAIDLDGYLFAYRIDSDTDEWERIFSGHYAAFINGHAPADALRDGTLKLIKTSSMEDCREWVTRGQLIKRHADAVAALASYRERFAGCAESIASYQSKIAALDLALQRYYEENNVE